ncbi:hypothetical protein GII30_01450 [Gordonia amarae]|uniref:Uncharacterized protein n=2 Tax=Gordonia amarae TaxID=36821 RepID=G7GRR5_9ACTN|nr:hypothetical protein [Gordonia amarae]MCS3877012.1 hypothetical protein [Gordonia amarae]QHN15829.1 hypothetical protein GII35_01450 [Gordonia amarae]QHN20397.1 hypothetical protein GII34_01450 [Gordonia amarae]QHN38028.1 hypothetical protein GII30_01450 [Gordonia amarae]GAB06290.1 hypothetical protein GOAMR_50_00620 [Gordonia amarae NBRC 15530]
MGPLFSFLSSYWWLVFPFAAIVGGWGRAVAAYNERRRRDKIELARIEAQSAQPAVTPNARQVAKTMATHDKVNERWFAYEMDLATLIDYPLLIDLSEPLTEAFHRARVRADTLRPADADDIDDAADVERYRDSVREYVVSFEAAEREARRRRDSGFTAAEQASLSRARKLVATAEDGGATPAERQTAYKKLRDELRGIIDVPSAAGERIERSIAQALERGRD